MAKLFTVSLTLLSLLFILLSLNSGRMVKLADADEEEKTWCVAKPSASDAELVANMDYACGQIGDCKIIQGGGGCFNPNTNINHASVAMNLYYQSMGRNKWNCDFIGTGLIVQTDPSYPNCQYA